MPLDPSFSLHRHQIGIQFTPSDAHFSIGQDRLTSASNCGSHNSPLTSTHFHSGLNLQNKKTSSQPLLKGNFTGRWKIKKLWPFLLFSTGDKSEEEKTTTEEKIQKQWKKSLSYLYKVQLRSTSTTLCRIQHATQSNACKKSSSIVSVFCCHTML